MPANAIENVKYNGEENDTTKRRAEGEGVCGIFYYQLIKY